MQYTVLLGLILPVLSLDIAQGEAAEGKLAGAWGPLACGQEQPKTPDVSDLPPGVRWLRDLKYVPGGHERQNLDLYLPEKASGSLPVKRAGTEVTLQVYKGAGHGGRAFTSPESWRLIEDFFARHLGAKKPRQQ